jgi:hypothetical protein
MFHAAAQHGAEVGWGAVINFGIELVDKTIKASDQILGLDRFPGLENQQKAGHGQGWIGVHPAGPSAVMASQLASLFIELTEPPG